MIESSKATKETKLKFCLIEYERDSFLLNDLKQIREDFLKFGKSLSNAIQNVEGVHSKLKKEIEPLFESNILAEQVFKKDANGNLNLLNEFINKSFERLKSDLHSYKEGFIDLKKKDERTRKDNLKRFLKKVKKIIKDDSEKGHYAVEMREFLISARDKSEILKEELPMSYLKSESTLKMYLKDQFKSSSKKK